MRKRFLSGFVDYCKTERTLEKNLARITDSGLVDFPEEIFKVVIQESHGQYGRQVIMTHICRCLTDVAKPKEWKRLHAAMILIEELMMKGSRVLLAETSAGLHFDILQKLSFLERFQHTASEYAQSVVRSKAQVLKSSLVYQLQAYSVKNRGKTAGNDTETESTCSSRGSMARSISSSISLAPFDNIGSHMDFLEHELDNIQSNSRCIESAPSSSSKPVVDKSFAYLLEWAETPCEDSDCDSCVDGVHSLGRRNPCTADPTHDVNSFNTPDPPLDL